MPVEPKPAVEVKAGNTVVDVTQDGKPFLVYNFATAHAGIYKPFFDPVMGPNGWPITQNGEFPGTLRGHYWHHALFVGHQKLSHRTADGSRSSNFWEEREEECGRMVHDRFEDQTSGDVGRFDHYLIWRAPDGREVLRETRSVRVPKAPPERRIIDITVRLLATLGPVRFEKTMYNLLACRVINAMCRREEKATYTERYGNLVDFRPLLVGGKIVNSQGRENDAVRGERAKWCDFSGPLDNSAVGGVAILDHPLNERHPTPWNNWNNMTITASFTFHDHFELALGKELRLKYRVLIHKGDAKQADVE